MNIKLKYSKALKSGKKCKEKSEKSLFTKIFEGDNVALFLPLRKSRNYIHTTLKYIFKNFLILEHCVFSKFFKTVSAGIFYQKRKQLRFWKQ